MAIRTLQDAAPIVGTAAGLTTATTAYTSGDVLGSEITLTGMAAATGGRGVITGISIENHSTQLGAVTLYIANAASTPAADNAAASWSDTNIRLFQVQQVMPALVSTALNQYVFLGGLWLPFTTNASANLFLTTVTGSGHTFFGAATDLQYTFHILQWV